MDPEKWWADNSVYEQGASLQVGASVGLPHTGEGALESRAMLNSPGGRRNQERSQGTLKQDSCRLPGIPAEGVNFQVLGAELGVVSDSCEVAGGREERNGVWNPKNYSLAF